MKGPICLIRDCEPYTQKMVKHLSTCHPDFTENQITSTMYPMQPTIQKYVCSYKQCTKGN